MKKTLFTSVFAAFALAATAADPAVSNQSLSFDEATGLVTVSYDLSGADAIVTVDFFDNGTLVEGARHVAGDVSRAISVGAGKKIYWQPSKDLGETNTASRALTATVMAWATTSPPDYYVLDLVDGRKRFYNREADLPEGIGSDTYRTRKMVFRRIPAANASFTMGAPATEQNNRRSSMQTSNNWGIETQHTVSFTYDWYMGVFEVTQKQWQNVYGNFPVDQTFPGDSLPVSSVATWQDIRCNEGDCGTWPSDGRYPQNTHFLGRLRLRAGGTQIAYPNHTSYYTVTGNGYDIPTEAQWEFSCRAGTTTAFYNGLELTNGETVSGLEDIAWYAANSGGTTHRVGEKLPNGWGLYDMGGNVSEWCRDGVYHRNDDTYYGEARTDPEGVGTYTGLRGRRGGHYGSSADEIRSAGGRWANDWGGVRQAGLGFRVMCPVDEL